MLTLFLGSGASPLLRCTVGEITAAVLNAKMDLDSQQRFAPRRSDSIPFSPFGAVIPEFLSRLQQDIARTKGIETSGVTYEQIGAVCIELDAHESNPRNPAIGEYWQKLSTKFSPQIKSRSCDPITEPFAKLVTHAVNWIRRVVELELTNPAHQPPDLGATPLIDLLDVALTSTPTWSVITLNHDLMIERSLNHLGLAFHDGFNLRDGILEFDPSIVRAGVSKLLLKLHGSVDWHWLPDKDNYIKRRLGDEKTDAWLARLEPEILFGDYTKMETYSYGVFPFLFSAFDRVLAATQRLLVCGYGFQDKGVNLRLFSELRYRPEMSVLLIHPEPRALINGVPFHARQQLKKLLCNDRIRLLRGRLDEVLAEKHCDRLQSFVCGG